MPISDEGGEAGAGRSVAGSAEARAAAAFRERFGGEPAWISAAPGRVNLIGEHTDYSGGFVLPIAIDRRCVVAGGPARDATRSCVFSSESGKEWQDNWEEPIAVEREGARGIAGPGRVRRGEWSSYVAGVVEGVRARMPAGARMRNLDLAIASDVPIGGGLSSSAALEVAVAGVLERALGLRLGEKEKAALCRQAEHDFAGVPCGVMDQIASVMGVEGHALLIDCRSLEVTRIPMPPEGRAAVLVVDSGVKHALASGEYAKRRAACVAAAALLGVGELRDADPGLLGAARDRLTDEQFRAARHVISENSRTLAGAAALRAGDLAGFGRLMVASHASLRDDLRVSCPELDGIVEICEGFGPNGGVFGARLTGGGFGGCAVVLARADAAGEVAGLISRGFEARFRRACRVFAVRAGGGAGLLRG